MSLAEPRVAPLSRDQLSDDQTEVLSRFGDFDALQNVFKTLARHAKLLKRWLPFANHVLFKSTLAPRDREILILRTAWLCRAEYEWGHHRVIAAREGLDPAEIERLADGPDAPGWSATDVALIRAADELHRDHRLSDAAWTALAAHFATDQILDVIFTVGNYTMLAMALNSCGVQLDHGLEGFRS